MKGSHYNIIDYAIHGKSEPGEIENSLFALEKDSQKDVDILLVKNLRKLLSHNYDIDRDFEDPSWRWFWQEIADGEYPLKKLPDHVCDIAKALYYQKSAQNQ